MKMRLGVFGSVADIDTIADAGFDCIEMYFQDLMAMTPEEFHEAKKKLNNSPLTAEVFNRPLPRDYKIAGEGFDMEFCREYLKKASDLGAEFGARYANFGNGGTRSIPENLPPEEYEDMRKRVLEVYALCCEIFAKNNITVLLEPLAPVVTNSVMNMPEALMVAKEVGAYNLKTFVDYRWFVYMKRPLNELVKYADQLQHFHIDNPISQFPVRYIPKLSDDFDYEPLMNTLKKICYKGIISCEANTFSDFKTDLKDLMNFYNHFDIYAYRS